MRTLTHQGDCVAIGGDRINAMRNHPSMRRVTYGTFRRHCEGIDSWAWTHGYDARSNSGAGVTLRADPFVGYFRSTLDGERCYFLTYSGYEHVWA